MFIFTLYVVLGTIMLLNLLIAVRLICGWRIHVELLISTSLYFRCWATRTTRFGRTVCSSSSWNAYVFKMEICLWVEVVL